MEKPWVGEKIKRKKNAMTTNDTIWHSEPKLCIPFENCFGKIGPFFVVYWDAIQVSAPTKYASIYTDKGRPHTKKGITIAKKAPSSSILHWSHH